MIHQKKSIKVVPVAPAKPKDQHVYIGEEFDLKNRTKKYWAKFDKIH